MPIKVDTRPRGATHKVTITGPSFINEQIAASLQGNPPKDNLGQAPMEWKANHTANGIEWDFGHTASLIFPSVVQSTLDIELTYPKPAPDIPALIRAWHASTTNETTKALWDALRNHSSNGWKEAPFHDGNMRYVAQSTGFIAVN
jgi:hypothetical protein